MNKFLLWSLMAIMVITGCAKDQTTAVNNGHAIGFRASTGTKASEIYTYQLSSFYCTAVDANNDNFFTNVGFGRAGDYFTSTPAYYWPADGSTLKFWAYAPSNTVMGTEISISNSEQLIKGFSPATDFKDQVDFITATAEGSKANEATGVELNFDHKLAQISIYAKNQNTEYVYKVYGLRIVNAQTGATYNFETDNWTFDEATPQKATYSTLLDEPVTLTSYDKELTAKVVTIDNQSEWVYNTAMIIPQTFTAWDPDADPDNSAKGAYLSIAIQITTKEGAQIFPETGEYGYVATPVSTALQKGYNHRYYLDFTNGAGYIDPESGETGSALGETIKFTVSVNPWDEPSAGQTIRRQLEGNWLAKKVERTYIYPEGYEGYRQENETISDETLVKNYFGGNGFYQFSVDNNYVIHMTTPDGTQSSSAMTVDDEGKVYLEAFRDLNSETGYYFIPIIDMVDDENKKSITRIDEIKTTSYNEETVEYIYRQLFYYDKF